MRAAPPLLAAVLLAALGCGGERPPGRLNLLLVSVDTLRADRLGCYGYERDTSPELDAFAAESVLFENAIAESSWTLPSHFTLLTGLHPLTHGVQHPLERPARTTPLLAEVLRDAGWSTFAVTGGGWLEPDLGFGRGFSTYETDVDGFDEALSRAKEYVDYLDGEEPWFAFLHTYDVHCPYDPAPPFRDAFRTPGRVELDTAGKCGNPDYNGRDLSPGELATISDRYDGGVREMDAVLGDFLRFLESSGALERTVVVFTSDHGEELGERGRVGHEGTLHAEVLRVPLVVRAPGVAPARVGDLAGLADLVPTVLALLGVDPAGRGQGAPPFDGAPLAPLVPDAPPRPPARLSTLEWKARLRATRDAAHSLVEDLDEGTAALYRWRGDPGEREPVRGGDAGAAATEALRARREALEEELRAGAQPTLDGLPLSARRRAELARLGYSNE